LTCKGYNVNQSCQIRLFKPEVAKDYQYKQKSIHLIFKSNIF